MILKIKDALVLYLVENLIKKKEKFTLIFLLRKLILFLLENIVSGIMLLKYFLNITEVIISNFKIMKKEITF